MLRSNFRVRRALGVLLLALSFACVEQANAGNNNNGINGFGFISRQSVGGVSINAEGVLSEPTQQEELELQKVRETARIAAPAALEEFTERRAVSLRQVEAALAKAQKERTPVPDEVKCLAGLQRVEYVLVYPERNDIVFVGPAEGWKIDRLGNVVGATTNRPVLLLDDLIVALRSGKATRLAPITCSIDPTPEGLARWQALAKRMKTIGNPEQTMARIEQALGPQVISVTGVAPTTHFARAMVAADFRMKRIAMNFEPSPVAGMPSVLQMMRAGGSGMSNALPRWWLAPNYLPLAQTADGLAWHLRGPGVKCLTEQDYIDEAGNKQRSGKASPVAAKWAATMTEKYDELATHDSVFGQLRNVMDLAVIGALIEKQQLFEQAGLQAPHLMEQAEPDSYAVPQRTSSKASFVKKGRKWLISASGGVEILPWQVADRSETVAAVGEVREEMAADVDEFWWE